MARKDGEKVAEARDQFDWSVIREARRQIGLATNAGSARAGRLLDVLLLGAPKSDNDPGELVSLEGGLMEDVVFHATMIAAERFNPDPADPGWSSEMHEDFLRDACIAFGQVVLTRRGYGA